MMLAAALRPGCRTAGGRAAAARAVIVAAGAAAIGGFWYIRNLIKLGHLFDPANARGFDLSLAVDWRNPRVYGGGSYPGSSAATRSPTHSPSWRPRRPSSCCLRWSYGTGGGVGGAEDCLGPARLSGGGRGRVLLHPFRPVQSACVVLAAGRPILCRRGRGDGCGWWPSRGVAGAAAVAAAGPPDAAAGQRGRAVHAEATADATTAAERTTKAAAPSGGWRPPSGRPC